MKALITGSNGFIGSHLTERLVADGVNVRCLVRPTSDLSNLEGVEVEYIFGDITEPGSLRQAVEGMDYVFHLGGITKAIDEKGYFDVNANGTRNLLDACVRYNPRVQRVVVVSSLAAGGPARADRPRVESDSDSPVTPYGRSKKAGDDLAVQYADRLPITILRPPAVYGPREKDILIFFKLVSIHLRPQIGFSSKYLSVIFVSDLVEAVVLSSASSGPSGSIYYVDDGEIHTWQSFSSAICRALETWALPLVVPESAVRMTGLFSEWISNWSGKPAVLNRQKVIELTQPSWATSSQKIRKELGFESKVALDAGCRLTVEWYRKRSWIN
ncbi:MAG: NAD-dependent epimerase/dehydratase family protein [Bacteroidetes bacterium]|nr:NAD-dependent epimerase/dehydratase family protein [Bacteroidota bacterium]